MEAWPATSCAPVGKAFEVKTGPAAKAAPEAVAAASLSTPKIERHAPLSSRASRAEMRRRGRQVRINRLRPMRKITAFVFCWRGGFVIVGCAIFGEFSPNLFVATSLCICKRSYYCMKSLLHVNQYNKLRRSNSLKMLYHQSQHSMFRFAKESKVICTPPAF
jgi:hypothetical protein